MACHFPHLLNPRIHPDDGRRGVRVPTWETFEHVTQFITLRDLAQTAWREDLERYTEQFNLGRVVWPLMNLLHCGHLAEVLDEILRRRLYLFDLWSYVPGSPLEGTWSNITPPPGMVRHLQRTLGDRFLGIDNGEQDGRYIWATAEQQCPREQSRCAQYLGFQRHFQKLCDELGNRMTALTSLTFGHYFLKEGNHLLLGAETAQALPNSQLYYAFIRGAGKQYGVHWFGNASVFNRWGWKDYGAPKRDGRYRSGPEEGSSLSLLKRLMYTHYLYNCVAVGFESGWLTETPPYALTPIGEVQRGAVEFVSRHGQPGVMHTPAALLLDFFAGWVPPRHLYTPYVYQVWGGMPYEAGDYLTHGVLSLLLPGYENASYFHDERGFLSPTPFGDMTDCLLSDAPLWVLRQYGLLVAAGALTVTRELADKLRAFVAGGGHLVVTAGNARGLLPGLMIEHEQVRVAAGVAVDWSDGTGEVEEHAFALCRATVPAGAEVLARCGELPSVVRVAHGEGHVTLLLSPFGLPAEAQHSGPIANAEEQPLACPFGLLRHVRRALGRAFAAEQLFTVGDGLGFVTCRRAAGDYLLALYNNGQRALPWRIDSRCGTIGSVRELELDRSEQGAVGQWPKGHAGGAAGGGRSDARTIAGGDIRLFAVSVQEDGMTLLPAPQPPPRPRNRLLALRGPGSVQEEILRRPTFFEHFDGVKLEWRYLRDRDPGRLRDEQDWLARHQVRAVVDFSRDLNLFPGLTLLDAYPPHYAASVAAIDGVLAKMRLCAARDAVIAVHRRPENHWTDERARAEFVVRIGELCRRAADHGVTLHLQTDHWKRLPDAAAVLDLVAEIGQPNLRYALNVGHLWPGAELPDEMIALAGERLGAVLLCAPRVDSAGQVYDAHLPVHGSGIDPAPLSAAGDVLFIFDAIYPDWDAEYLDAQALRRALGS
ncbi:MAG: TIM barrel protein [Spirochaetaceae bacterium]|nr:TIM barrel protein [Spirochaetaceae bacterium]